MEEGRRGTTKKISAEDWLELPDAADAPAQQNVVKNAKFGHTILRLTKPPGLTQSQSHLLTRTLIAGA